MRLSRWSSAFASGAGAHPVGQWSEFSWWATSDHNLVCADDKDIEEEMKTMDKISLIMISLIMIVTIFCCCYCCWCWLWWWRCLRISWTKSKSSDGWTKTLVNLEILSSYFSNCHFVILIIEKYHLSSHFWECLYMDILNCASISWIHVGRSFIKVPRYCQDVNYCLILL